MPGSTTLKSSEKLEIAPRLKLLKLIMESRHGDLRQESLNRQGKGHFHVSGMGHEALAAIGLQLAPGDYICPYYRDRGMMLGRGVTTQQLAQDYFAKRESSSRGRQMPAHYSYPELNVWSVPTPTASQLLPACGIAWGLQLDKKPNVVVTSLGDASTRQGDFYEAIAFAEERKLPVLFIVEDNAYGISTPTRKMNPLALGVLARERWREIDGSDPDVIFAETKRALAELREGKGPVCFWITLERLTSHTSSDDQKIYRPASELENLSARDPLVVLRKKLIAEGALDEESYARLDLEIKERVREAYLVAETSPNPLAEELEAQVLSADEISPPKAELFSSGKYRIGDIVNRTLRDGLLEDQRRIIFGEDIEDPKGGVFRLTKGLSTEFPKNVFNSPLAESTILGVACGLASYGRRPVFEVQFIDFIYPGWNQLVTNLATLRWRTYGGWKCPAVIYAPYGAYLPGGSLWHSQANEAAIAHFPGINVVIPSTPEDAAGLLYTAMHAEDPTVFLVPKHLLWAERETAQPIVAVPLGKARRRTEGSDVTVVAWGNTMERAMEALSILGEEVSVELIDLRSIAPWDSELITASVRKTGRLVVVQEDTENCSVGQMILSHVCSCAETWERIVSPPVLVSKGNVMIGYNPIYEYAALPDERRIAAAIRQSIANTTTRTTLARATTSHNSPHTTPVMASHHSPSKKTAAGSADVQVITVPIMGEGIRSARIAVLHKKPGDAVKPDDVLCEVETEKAVYPIEAARAGIFAGWKVKPDDTVLIGQEIALVAAPGADWQAAATHTTAIDESSHAIEAASNSTLNVGGPHEQPAIPLGATRCEPALSAAITRRLKPVIPATIEAFVDWSAIRTARAAAKEADPEGAPSPSMMIAWMITRTMEQHTGFRRVVLPEGIYELGDFDLGVAVALPGDKLGTAVVPMANRLSWGEFQKAYATAIQQTRLGKIADIQAPLLISSLGGFGVRMGIPIVVPPSMSTLFVGASHHEMVRNGNTFKAAEVVSVVLTFDHCVVNGAGAAAFLNELTRRMERFELPALTAKG